jgi:hypothetical protein
LVGSVSAGHAAERRSVGQINSIGQFYDLVEWIISTMKKKVSKDNEIQTKLSVSTAMQSLTMERKIAIKLDKLKWDVVHSCYYMDPKENKLREIDVTGTKAWIRQNNKRETTISRLHLIIECKTAKGFHLLFSPIIPENHFASLHDEWYGVDDQDHRKRFTDMLEVMKLSEDQKATIFEHYKKIIYSDEETPDNRLYIRSFPTPLLASAFRETNIGADKEGEISILWKAGQALASAVKSFREESLTETLDDISFVVDIESLYGKQDLLQTAIEQLNLHAGQLDIYHPIVVIDCMLWEMNSKSPRRIDWCRLMQSDIDGFSNWWFDVVSNHYFDRYITKLSQYYNQEFRKEKSRLLNIKIKSND